MTNGPRWWSCSCLRFGAAPRRARLCSFEQLCINLANEQLQSFFNNHIFAMEMKEYMAEGIMGATINFVDNKVG